MMKNIIGIGKILGLILGFVCMYGFLTTYQKESRLQDVNEYINDVYPHFSDSLWSVAKAHIPKEKLETYKPVHDKIFTTRFGNFNVDSVQSWTESSCLELDSIQFVKFVTDIEKVRQKYSDLAHDAEDNLISYNRLVTRWPSNMVGSFNKSNIKIPNL